MTIITHVMEREGMKIPPVRITSDNVIFSDEKTSFWQIHEVPEYRFEDIRPDDRVIDIGANVGAFCIRAARFSPHVTAVEPVTFDILEKNIRKNKVPVGIIQGALGNGKPCEICWDNCRVTTPTFTLGTLIGMAGGCDFLKCDCEGAEWLIRPSDLSGVRRIEMELHMPPICAVPDMALLDYVSRQYDFAIERRPCHDVMGVMGILHAEQKT
ncbi:FkbM family methyltransferase [uncultured Methanoregula sp.]|uniref:FkbM family methyltransferase n=1 Tax=uncultured Methanoregula sp. TaxID=1005933 RepID=UPI002AAAF34E|nr:FkbM family methyltransferase [uncultured Methanoregula sp.]